MNMPYLHRQVGTVMLSMIASTWFALSALSAVAAPNLEVILPIILLSAGILGVLAVLFSSLTIQVHDNRLSWYFGLGFWRKAIPLTDIERVTAIKSKWYWGYGIKYFGSGRWLYNVSGTDAVELQLRSHGWVRLGTDDVAGLVQALRSRGL